MIQNRTSISSIRLDSILEKAPVGRKPPPGPCKATAMLIVRPLAACQPASAGCWADVNEQWTLNLLDEDDDDADDADDDDDE